MKHSLLLVALLGLGGCKNALLVEQSESSLENRPKTFKVICIDPGFTITDSDFEKMDQSAKFTDWMLSSIERFPRGLNLDVVVYDAKRNADPLLYQQLLPLKRNMLRVNLTERTPYEQRVQLQENKIEKKIFLYPPKVLPEFNSLVATFGTSYFSYLGMSLQSKQLILYHLVVNVETGETIYREKKVVTTPLSRTKVDQMIYDSFALMKQQLLGT